MRFAVSLRTRRGATDSCRSWWQWVVSRLRVHVQAGAGDLHLNGSKTGARRGATVITQRVLVAGFAGNFAVGGLNGGTIEFGKHLSRRGRSVLGENVTGAEPRQVNLLDGAKAGNSRRINADSIDGDVLGKQHLQDVAIAGVAAQLLT